MPRAHPTRETRPPSPPGPLRRRLRGVRRAVLARRRLLAAVLAAVAVGAGLRAATAPAPELVTVTVAARDLPAGTVLGAGDLTTASYAPGSEPGERVRDPLGRRLASPLRRGEVVTDVRLVGPGLSAASPGRVATPVRLPDGAMAGLLRVGDHVDLVSTDPRGRRSEVVATGVPVLAVPPVDRADGAGPDGLTGRIVVLGLDETAVTLVSRGAVGHFLGFAWSR